MNNISFSFQENKPSLYGFFTCDIERFSTDVLYNNLLYKIMIYDSSGMERLRNINEFYLRKVDSCILVYDITRKYTFQICKDYYIPTIKENCKNKIKVILLGNKSDLEEKREVSWEEGNELAISNNYYFLETSCKKYKNIFESFDIIIKNSEIEKETHFNENFRLTNKKNKKRQSCF